MDILNQEDFILLNKYDEREILKFSNSISAKINVHSEPSCNINYKLSINETAFFLRNKDKTIIMWFIFIGYESGERVYQLVFKKIK